MSTPNGKPPGQYIQQISPLSEPCPNCGVTAMVGRCEVLLAGASYIHIERGAEKLGRVALIHALCFNCGRRFTVRFDDQGKPTTTVLFEGWPPLDVVPEL